MHMFVQVQYPGARREVFVSQSPPVASVYCRNCCRNVFKDLFARSLRVEKMSERNTPHRFIKKGGFYWIWRHTHHFPPLYGRLAPDSISWLIKRGEAWSFKLKGRCRPKMFEIREFKKTFGPKRGNNRRLEKITYRWASSFVLTNFIWVIKAREMAWSGHDTRIWKKGKTRGILFGNLWRIESSWKTLV